MNIEAYISLCQLKHLNYKRFVDFCLLFWKVKRLFSDWKSSARINTFRSDIIIEMTWYNILPKSGTDVTIPRPWSKFWTHLFFAWYIISLVSINLLYRTFSHLKIANLAVNFISLQRCQLIVKNYIYVYIVFDNQLAPLQCNKIRRQNLYIFIYRNVQTNVTENTNRFFFK